MRLILALCALATSGSAALAQVSTGIPLRAREREHPRSIDSSGGSGTDSLQLSRRQAIAEALTRNAQLEIAREQTAQARARRVSRPSPFRTRRSPRPSIRQRDRSHSAVPVPGPSGLASPSPSPTSSGSTTASDGRTSERASPTIDCSNRRSRSQASATYDSLLAALKHREYPARSTRRSRPISSSGPRRATRAAPQPKLDVIQAQVGVAQSENDLIANERDIANAQASLNRTLGRVIGAPIAPTDSLDVPPAAARLRDDRTDRAGQSAGAGNSPAAASRRAARARVSSRSSGSRTSRLPSSATTSRPDRRCSPPGSRCRCPRSTGSTPAATSRRPSTSSASSTRPTATRAHR